MLGLKTPNDLERVLDCLSLSNAEKSSLRNAVIKDDEFLFSYGSKSNSSSFYTRYDSSDFNDSL